MIPSGRPCRNSQGKYKGQDTRCCGTWEFLVVSVESELRSLVANTSGTSISDGKITEHGCGTLLSLPMMPLVKSAHLLRLLGEFVMPW